MKIVFGLNGLNAVELHGNLTQNQVINLSIILHLSIPPYRDQNPILLSLIYLILPAPFGCIFNRDWKRWNCLEIANLITYWLPI